MLIPAGLNDFEDFSPLPVGNYSFTIKEPAEVIPNVSEKTDIGGSSYAFVVFAEVTEGPQAGKRVRRQSSNRSKANRYFLRTFLEKIGVNIQDGGGFASEDILGRQFKASVSERMYKDKDGNDKKAAELDVESIVAV